MCDFRQWIDTERSWEALDFICKRKRLREQKEESDRHRAWINKRKAERQREIDDKLKKEKEMREIEREKKRERARRAKEAIARGGEDAIRKGKWPRATQ